MDQRSHGRGLVDGLVHAPVSGVGPTRDGQHREDGRCGGGYRWTETWAPSQPQETVMCVPTARPADMLAACACVHNREADRTATLLLALCWAFPGLGRRPVSVTVSFTFSLTLCPRETDTSTYGYVRWVWDQIGCLAGC